MTSVLTRIIRNSHRQIKNYEEYIFHFFSLFQWGSRIRGFLITLLYLSNIYVCMITYYGGYFGTVPNLTIPKVRLDLG